VCADGGGGQLQATGEGGGRPCDVEICQDGGPRPADERFEPALTDLALLPDRARTLCRVADDKRTARGRRESDLPPPEDRGDQPDAFAVPVSCQVCSAISMWMTDRSYETPGCSNRSAAPTPSVRSARCRLRTSEPLTDSITSHRDASSWSQYFVSSDASSSTNCSGRICAQRLQGRFRRSTSRSDSVTQVGVDHVAHRPAGDGVELGALLGSQLVFEGGEPGCEGRGLVLGDGQVGGLLQQLLEADRLLAVERRLDEVVLGDPEGVDEHEAGLLLGVGRDCLEVG
jgi:hypothetical protein